MENTGSNKKIFREKSMEQLSTPEQLTGYLRVTGPGVWIVLAGLAILLAGLLVWGIFGRLVSTVTVPAKVESIGEYAFSFCTELKNVKLQEGIRSIQPHAFQSCLSIGRMIFPASLREIAENAFANCSNITRIEFNGDTGLASFSFSDCFYMKEAVFYKNPTNINEYAFSGNSLLTFYSELESLKSTYSMCLAVVCSFITVRFYCDLVLSLSVSNSQSTV